MLLETSLRFLGWCPVCERDIKVRSGLLVHHGYQRPGVGYIIGDCPGVGYEPYETGTGAADAYLNNDVRPSIDETRRSLEVLTSERGPDRLYFQNYDIKTGRFIRDRIGHIELIPLTRAEANDLEAQVRGYDRGSYSWERGLKAAIAQTESKLKFWERERTRIEGLIGSWQQKPLRTIDEEIARQRQSKAEREAARTDVKNAKVAAEVLKIQKRIDAAVRNKNSSTLADIYKSTKLKALSGYRLSDDEALALLDRDNVWRAFGLLSAGDEVELLDDMMWGKKVPTTAPGLRYERIPMPWPAALGGGKAKTRG